MIVRVHLIPAIMCKVTGRPLRADSEMIGWNAASAYSMVQVSRLPLSSSQVIINDPPTHNILPSFPWKPQQTFLFEEKLVHSGLEGAKNSDDQRSGDGRLLWGGRTERGLEISDL